LEDELKNEEVNILRNELDPHFVYNSLMPLYYLIKNDVSKAEAFTYKLMQVYQHLLENRRKDLFLLKEELKFIHNYLYLLQIRYKDCLFLKTTLPEVISTYSIIPFTLQLLIENAVKHNHLSKDNPLEIEVSLSDSYLV
jgi:LytS/YehU family sensor histidine kinase